jgi:methionyl-tRNA formyltransferase
MEEFTPENLKEIAPDKIFIPHWSYIIPGEIYKNYECVVFHMTDLPFGRGGSPLQNLITRGYIDTKISALKVADGLDTGEIYLKKDLSLLGTAEEIFIRTSLIISEMIKEIVDLDLKPVPQEGTVTEFKRRKKEDSDISKLNEITEIYDYIRMLDAEGFPKAYLDMGDFRLEFSRASLKTGENIIADVRIFKK